MAVLLGLVVGAAAAPPFELGSLARGNRRALPANGTSRTPQTPVDGSDLALLYDNGAGSVIYTYEVEGAAMAPTLHNGEFVLVDGAAYRAHPPARGDIVVFAPPVDSAQPYIKRVIGLPGESIGFEGGYVYIDGVKLDEPYIDGPITECIGPCAIARIPDGYVYVLGDNRDNSSDSRAFGPVRIEDIVGKAWFAYEAPTGRQVPPVDYR